jgi:hypothetical protein
MTTWRIYYWDGSTFDSTMGTMQEAPSFGVICIVQPNEYTGRTIVSGYDWYYFNEEIGEWWQSDIHGLLDNLLHDFPITAVKQGRNAPDSEYKAIMVRAIQDPDFPVKNATMTRECP